MRWKFSFKNPTKWRRNFKYAFVFAVIVVSLGAARLADVYAANNDTVFKGPYWQNYSVELIGTLVAALLGYLLRHEISELLDRLRRSKRRTIRLPVMTAAAPIMVGTSKKIWRDHDIDLYPKWRYAGRDALVSLAKSEDGATMAVASDYAIAKLLQGKDREFSVLPFAIITDHMRIIARNDCEDSEFERWQIAYYPDSAHEELLLKMGRTPDKQEMFQVKTVFDGLLKLWPAGAPARTADAFVLWEPHYMTYSGQSQFRVVPPRLRANMPHTWILCVVMRKFDAEMDEQFVRRFTRALGEACDQCRDLTLVAQACAECFPEELLGINSEKLESVLKEDGPHEWSIEKAIARLKQKTADESNYPGAQAGCAILQERITQGNLWPGIKSQTEPGNHAGP